MKVGFEDKGYNGFSLWVYFDNSEWEIKGGEVIEFGLSTMIVDALLKNDCYSEENATTLSNMCKNVIRLHTGG